jgi:uncharacterized protein YaaN involved in tellurite resistance
MNQELQLIQDENYQFNAEETTKEVEERAKNAPEVASISRQLDIKSAESIMTFGGETAVEISKFSDQILNNMKTTNVEDSGTLLLQLNKIMNKFDAQDFEEKKKNFLDKMFSGAKNSIENLLKKYESMGGEVDKVYLQLKTYEREILTSNSMLEGMFEKNIEYYELLQKYIYAGNMALEHLKNNDIKELELKVATNNDQLDQVNLNNLLQAVEMVEQRVYDLELAKNVALQSLPQIKLIQRGNYNLMRKINSAFIVTLPIFKQSLTQAIALKRQGIQAQAMAALDEKTNELLLKNAQNTAMQSKITAQLASGSSIDVATLEKSWQLIVQGIQETQKIQDEAKQNRIDGVKRLEQIQDEFHSKTKLIR